MLSRKNLVEKFQKLKKNVKDFNRNLISITKAFHNSTDMFIPIDFLRSKLFDFFIMFLRLLIKF